MTQIVQFKPEGHGKKKQQQIAIWQKLLNAAGGGNEVENPRQLLEGVLIEGFGLTKASAYQQSLNLLSKLAESRKIEPIYGSGGRGRPSIVKVKLLDKLPLSFEESIESSTLKPKKVSQDGGENTASLFGALMKKIELVELKVDHLNASRAVEKRIQNRNRVAVWIDGPNFFKNCEEFNLEMPIPQMLHEIRENCGEIIFKAVFQSPNCPEGILRIFKTFDFHIFSCVSAKKYTSGYDPTDEELEKVAKELIEIAGTHVIVSADKDFNPLLSHIRQTGRDASRVYLSRKTSSVVLALKEKYVPIQSRQKRINNASMVEAHNFKN